MELDKPIRKPTAVGRRSTRCQTRVELPRSKHSILMTTLGVLNSKGNKSYGDAGPGKSVKYMTGLDMLRKFLPPQYAKLIRHGKSEDWHIKLLYRPN